MSITKIIEPLALRYFHSPEFYTPLPCSEDRNYWDHLDKKMKNQLIAEGTIALRSDYPNITASDFMNFTLTGNRIDYENRYFERRHMLNKLVLAECVTHNDTFLSKIADGIWLLCEESSWVLPAHNSYVRNEAQLILPDVSRPVLDLFACETGAQLSMVKYLLQKQLDRLSPLICQRIDHEVQKRILLPYIQQHFWWMGNEEEPMCNWTPWCTQNILLTAFLPNNLLSGNQKQDILKKAAYSLDCFLKDYGEDGCCDEGAQYYRHAGLCLYACLEIMNAVTHDHFSSLYENSKIKNMAAYVYHMHVVGPCYFNFADCSPMAGSSGAREYLFGKATKQDFLMDFAAEDYFASYCAGTLLEDESQALNLYFRSQTVYMLDEILSYPRGISKASPTEAIPPKKLPPDLYYQSVGIWISKSNIFQLAVKAGSNGDSHNHNDTGSFILYKNGKPIFIDIGVETYTKKTFSPNRYDIWTMQSCYHNLPVINGKDQSAGKEYAASQISLGSTDEESWIKMDLSTAYQQIDNPYIRKIILNKEAETVTLMDASNDSVILNFITYSSPVITNTGAASNALTIGDAFVSCEGATILAVETLPITDPRLMKAWDHDLYRIRMKSDTSHFTMKVT